MRRIRGRSRKRIIKKSYAWFLIVATVIIIVALFLMKYYSTKGYVNTSIYVAQNTETTNTNIVEDNTPKDIGASIAVVGNIRLDNDILSNSYNSENNSYNFSNIFKNIERDLKYVDITIGTFENNISNTNSSSFRELISSLADCGFDILSTSTEYSLKGTSSLISNTISELEKKEIFNIGTYKTKEESNDILIKSIEGFKIAFLSYSSDFSNSSNNYYINTINKDFIKEQIDISKNKGADVICVNLHWGSLYSSSPSQEQEELVDFLFENGVDIILGSHPNVVQPMEIREIKLENGQTKNRSYYIFFRRFY